MGMKIKALIVAIALAALAATVVAQPTGGGGGGQGRQRGGFGGRFGPVGLLLMKSVQEELKLTDDQKTKITALQTEIQAEMQQAREDNGQDREAMMAAMKKINDDALTKANAILTADQQTRFKQLRIQRYGSRALLQDEVQKDLAFTDDQKAKAKDLGDKADQANRDLFQKVRSSEITQEDASKARKENDETLGKELAKLLTADQAAKFKDMQGAPFKFPEQPMGGPGGPGGPGGGGPGGPGGGGPGGGGGAGG